MWDALKGRKLVELKGHKGFVSIARFDPGDRRVATASNDYAGMIWDADTGVLLSTIKGLEHRIMNIEFNPDANINRVLTISLDNTIRIWDPRKETAQEVLQIRRDSKLIYATWSPDGRTIVSCWKDGVVRLHKTVAWENLKQVTGDNEMTRQVEQLRAAPY